MFFGTPFKGRAGYKVEVWNEQLILCHTTKRQKFGKAIPLLKIWRETMSTSIPGNPYLRDMVLQFQEIRLHSPIPLWCFYETEPSPVWKLIGRLVADDSWTFILVPEDAAC